VIQLCESLGWRKLPSEILDEPMEWIVRMIEYFYQASKGKSDDDRRS
jgi:hypothetical protein